MTLLRYSKICDVDNSWPSSVMISSVLRGEYHDLVSCLAGRWVGRRRQTDMSPWSMCLTCWKSAMSPDAPIMVDSLTLYSRRMSLNRARDPYEAAPGSRVSVCQ